MATRKTSTATSSRKTTTSKTTSKAKPKAPAKSAATPATKPAAKPAAPKAESAAPVQGVTLTPAPVAAAITKKALFERVKKRVPGAKGRDLRLAMDAVLTELGEALVAGETLKLPPLGNMKVQRQKETGGADLVTCKLRRKKPVPEGNDPLAKENE